MKQRQRPERGSSKEKLNVYSYYGSRRPEARGAREKRQKASKSSKSYLKAIKHKVSPFRAAVVVLILLGCGVLLYASSEPIIRLDENDVASRGPGEYKSAATASIKGSIFNRSKLTFDYQKTENDLVAKYPEIADVDIMFDFFGDKPVIKLTLYKPVIKVLSGSDSWIIDNRGVAIGKDSAVADKAKASLPVIKDEIGMQIDIGTPVLSPKETEFLLSILSSLTKASVSVDDLFIPQTPQQLDISLKGEGWRYKLSSDEPAAEQAGALLAARQTLKGAMQPKEYVDVRSGEKVFWR